MPAGVWPALAGAYLFADGGAGKVWVRTGDGAVDVDAPLLTGTFGLTDMAFVSEPTGSSLYYTLNGASQVRRLRLGALTAGGTLELAVAGVGGRVCVLSHSTVDVLADVAGFFPAGSEFVPSSNPVRVLDTRNGMRVSRRRARVT